MYVHSLNQGQQCLSIVRSWAEKGWEIGSPEWGQMPAEQRLCQSHFNTQNHVGLGLQLSHRADPASSRHSGWGQYCSFPLPISVHFILIPVLLIYHSLPPSPRGQLFWSFTICQLSISFHTGFAPHFPSICQCHPPFYPRLSFHHSLPLKSLAGICCHGFFWQFHFSAEMLHKCVCYMKLQIPSIWII